MRTIRLPAILIISLFAAGAQARADAPAACLGIGDKAAPQPDSLPGTVSMVYRRASGRSLRLHVRAATGTSGQGGSGQGGAPAIVLFFGGGWRYGAIDQFDGQARALAAAGFTTILADYRVLCRDGTNPSDAMDDAAAAMRFVRTRAALLGVDPHRLAAGGGSAGGQLAMSTAFDPDGQAHPDALLLFNPVIDLDTGGLSSGFPGFPEAAARTASPAAHANAAYPPMLILHGIDDPLVPIAQVRRFCDAVGRNGGSCRLVSYAGARHGFFNRTVMGGRWFKATLVEATAFLDGVLESGPVHEGIPPRPGTAFPDRR